MSLKKIRLELARTPGFPEGSGRHGYEFTAPLDAKGNLDAAGWAKAKEACSVLRFWDGEPDEHGAGFPPPAQIRVPVLLMAVGSGSARLVIRSPPLYGQVA